MTIFNKLSPDDRYSMLSDIAAGLVCLAIIIVGWILFDVIESYGTQPERVQVCRDQFGHRIDCDE